jgi:2-polyprenyl-3-methyl-5-hydroxy-6-metoxy-1,4-benzoquinol methylase
MMTTAQEPERLAETIRFLLRRPDIGAQIGKKARETVLEKMSFEVLAQQYKRIYEEIANRKSPHGYTNYRSFQGFQFHRAKDLELMDPDQLFRECASPQGAKTVENREAQLFSPSCNLCGGKDHEVVDGTNRRLLEGLKIAQCRRCGHVFLNPRIRETEDIHSTTLDYLKNCYLREYTNLGCLRNGKTFLAKANYRYHLPFLEAISPFRVCNRILDYGCAIGLFLQAARMEGWECHGLEMSQLLSFYGQKNFHLDIRCGILEESDYQEEYFDAITFLEVIEHLFTPAEALAKAHKLLRPGGVVLITTPNFQSLEHFLAGKDWEICVSDHQHYFALDTLKNLLRQKGFEILKMHTSPVNLHEYNQRFGYERVKEAVERYGVTSENINLLFGASIISLGQKAAEV